MITAELEQVAFHLKAATSSLDAGYSAGAFAEISNAAAILDVLFVSVMAQTAVSDICNTAPVDAVLAATVGTDVVVVADVSRPRPMSAAA